MGLVNDEEIALVAMEVPHLDESGAKDAGGSLSRLVNDFIGK